MNAPVRTPTAAQVTSGAVLDRSLRGAHDIEVLLATFIGTVDFEARHAVLSDAQRTEARTIAGYLAAHVATLMALADGSVQPAPAWSADDLGIVIQEAVANHNDVDGVAWSGVARDVAGAIGIVLAREPA